MKQKYLFIPADLRKPCSFVEIDPERFNDDVHRLIDCDLYEHVYIKAEEIVFIVDESGKIKDPPKPVNVRASEFYPGTMYGDPIVGDVIVGSIAYLHDVDEPGFYDVPMKDSWRRLMCYCLGCPELDADY